jgi:hypothetical protein
MGWRLGFQGRNPADIFSVGNAHQPTLPVGLALLAVPILIVYVVCNRQGRRGVLAGTII